MSKRADLARMVGISAAESQSQRVETRLIEPRSFSQSQATFELPQEGILSSDVALQIQLKTDEVTANDRMDLPLMAGILGCIERAELFFGTTLISSVEELPHLMQLKNCFVDQDIRDQTHNVYLGAFSGLKTIDGGASGGGTNGWGQFSLNAIDSVTNAGTNASQGVLGLVQSTADQVNKLDHFRTTGNDNTPFFCIKLKDIFPVLNQIPLPLFALKERVRFVFHFSPDLAGNRAVAVKTNAGSAALLPFRGVNNPGALNTGNLIQQSSLKLSTDLIYYEDIAGVPSPMMRIQEELEKGANLVMTDYVSIFNTLPIKAVGAGTKAEQKLNTLLGLDHQIVRNILIATPPAPNFGANPTEPANRILGNYLSKGSNDQTVLQVSINNENIFPSPLNTTAKLYNELSQVHDSPLKVNRGLYSSNGQTTGAGAYPIVRADAAFNESQFTQGNINSELNFSLNYLGINLAKNATENYAGNGIQVGRQPVVINLTRDRVPTENSQLRVLYWAECERMMLIKSGNIFMSGQ